MKKYTNVSLVFLFAWLLSSMPVLAQTGNTDLPNPTPNLITAPA